MERARAAARNTQRVAAAGEEEGAMGLYKASCEEKKCVRVGWVQGEGEDAGIYRAGDGDIVFRILFASFLRGRSLPHQK